jgi:hypothetical protein
MKNSVAEKLRAVDCGDLQVWFGVSMDSSLLRVQVARCRSLAEKADPFTKRRLLDLAEAYDFKLGGPSRASRSLWIPGSLMEARLQQTRNDGA